MSKDLHVGCTIVHIFKRDEMRTLVARYYCTQVLNLKALDSFVVVEIERQIIDWTALFPFFEEKLQLS